METENQYNLLEMAWVSQPAPVSDAINAVFRRWTGTPYLAGHRVRGVGVDCIQLMVGLLDDLYLKQTPTPLNRNVRAATYSDRESASLDATIRGSFNCDIIRDGSIEPGDLVLTRDSVNSKGPRVPGHVMMVGPSRGTAFHASRSSGACLTDLTLIPILRVCRFLDKSTWAR